MIMNLFKVQLREKAMNNALNQATTQPGLKYFLRALGYFAVLALVNRLARIFGPFLVPSAPAWLAVLIEDLAYLVGVVALTWAFCRFVDRGSLRDLGLQKRGWLPLLAAGLGLGAFLELFVVVVLAVAGGLTIELSPSWPSIALVASVVSWIITSFNEELAFRGYIMQRLDQAWGTVAAVVVSSIVFSLVHIFNPNVDLFAIVNLFVAGLLLACGYLVTRSLWLPIGFHIAWNLAEIHILGLPGSGISEPSIFRTFAYGPEFVTGGGFGPEGGILGLVAPLLGIVILLLGRRTAPVRKKLNEIGGKEPK
jgi:membrane protease YdiL (CAAX protease family)